MNFSAVLLAGGESRRMGHDKATIEWRGRPLWQWQLEKLRALHPAMIFLSARTDVSWRPADVTLIMDLLPSRGPLSGLTATIEAIETEFLLVLAVDMPSMTTEHLRTLCDLATNETGVMPVIDAQAEPLAAIYPKGAGRLFLEALQTNNFSLQPIVRKLVDQNQVRELVVVGQYRDLYQSINEPGDVG